MSWKVVFGRTCPRLHNYLKSGSKAWCLTSYLVVISLRHTNHTDSLVKNSDCLNSSSTTARGTLGRFFSVSGFWQAQLWMLMTRSTCEAAVRMGLASRGRDLPSCIGPCAQKGPPCGWMLCCCHIEIRNNVIFELVLWKWSPKGQWRVGRQDSAVCAFAILAAPFACSVCPWVKKFQWNDGWELRETQSEYKVSVLHLWLGKQGWGEVSFHSNCNVCLKCTKNAVVFQETQTTEKAYHVFSYPWFTSSVTPPLKLQIMTQKERKR